MGESSFYIMAAYGAAFVVFLGLLAASVWELRRQKRLLAALEEQPSGRGHVPFLLPLGFVVLLLGFGAAALLKGPSQGAPQEVPVFELPPLEGLDLSGVSTEDFQGQVSVVNFWASWCPPCRVEHPFLMRLAQEEVQMVGIVYKDTDAHARRFLGAYGNPFERVGADRRGMIGLAWGLFGVPETYVVGPAGRILVRHRGPLSEESLRDLILPAVREAVQELSALR